MAGVGRTAVNQKTSSPQVWALMVQGSQPAETTQSSASLPSTVGKEKLRPRRTFLEATPLGLEDGGELLGRREALV